MAFTSKEQWIYFFQLALIIKFHRVIGYVFKKIFRCPRIIGDIIAGCLLGPTIMGVDLNNTIFPPDTREVIMMCGHFGIILISMGSGAGFDFRDVKDNKTSVEMFAFLNHIIPIVFAALVYDFLPNTSGWRGPNHNNGSFFTFLISIFACSALPMVFVILDSSTGAKEHELRKFCKGWSCFCTMILFILLAIATTLADPSPTTSIGLLILRNIGIYVIIIIGLGLLHRVWNEIDRRHELREISRQMETIGNDRCLNIIVMVLLIAGLTFMIDYTFLIGAFLGGMFMPFNPDLRKDVVDRIRWVTRWILLPQFFVFVGLSFNLRLLSGKDWGYLIALLILSFISKALLAIPTKFILKYSWRDSLFIATLASCKGINGLIIASVAQITGIAGPAFYSFCVLSSLLSSAFAGPVCRFLKRPSLPPPAIPRLTLKGEEPDYKLGKKEEPFIDEDSKLPEGDFEVEPPASRRGAGGSAFVPSILQDDERQKTMHYLWVEDVVNLLHDSTYGLAATVINPRNAGKPPNSLMEIFSGQEIVDWVLRYYHLPLRSYAERVSTDLRNHGYLQLVTLESLSSSTAPSVSPTTSSSSSRNLFSTSVLHRPFDDPENLFRLTKIAREFPLPVKRVKKTTTPSSTESPGT